jgi:hypothetical protein
VSQACLQPAAARDRRSARRRTAIQPDVGYGRVGPVLACEQGDIKERSHLQLVSLGWRWAYGAECGHLEVVRPSRTLSRQQRQQVHTDSAALQTLDGQRNGQRLGGSAFSAHRIETGQRLVELQDEPGSIRGAEVARSAEDDASPMRLRWLQALRRAEEVLLGQPLRAELHERTGASFPRCERQELLPQLRNAVLSREATGRTSAWVCALSHTRHCPHRHVCAKATRRWPVSTHRHKDVCDVRLLDRVWTSLRHGGVSGCPLAPPLNVAGHVVDVPLLQPKVARPPRRMFGQIHANVHAQDHWVRPSSASFVFTPEGQFQHWFGRSRVPVCLLGRHNPPQLDAPGLEELHCHRHLAQSGWKPQSTGQDAWHILAAWQLACRLQPEAGVGTKPLTPSP